MIELKEIDLNLVKRIEKINMTDYGVVEIRDKYYIEADDLFVMIDDLEDKYKSLEYQINDLKEQMDEIHDECVPTTDKHYIDEINKLKEENEILRNNALFYCNEDDLDRLAFEGVEL